jgi:hypothetical protein
LKALKFQLVKGFLQAFDSVVQMLMLSARGLQGSDFHLERFLTLPIIIAVPR